MRTRAALFVLAASIAMAGPAAAQSKAAVIGSLHDVRSNTVGDACLGCHTPHNANTGSKALLWNRTYIPTAGSFTPYDLTTNPDFKGGPVALGTGSASSLLCMSCHDGTTALSAVIAGNIPAGMTFKTGNATGLTGTGAGAAPGNDLSNDHPVGFVYDVSLAAMGTTKLYQNPDSTGKVKLFGSGTTRRVECGSCHDSHNNALGRFLRSTNDNSALCLACHV